MVSGALRPADESMRSMTMRYAVLLYEDERVWEGLTPDEQAAGLAKHDRYAARVAELGGTVLGGEPLQPTATATCVRWDGDEMTVTEGPFAETAEQFGGFYLVDMPDLDAAIEAVKELPHDAEVRPVVVHELPAGAGDASAAVEGDLYAVLLYGEEETWLRASPEEREQIYAQHGRFGALIAERGAAYAGGEELAHSSTATTVRHTANGIVISDGPYAETTEQLTGYYLIRAKGADVIVDLLQALPGGTDEIRPVMSMGASSA
jgi:hypothetical protein